MKKYFFSRCLIPIIILSFFYSCASFDRTDCTKAANPGECFAGVGPGSAAGGMKGVPDD